MQRQLDSLRQQVRRVHAAWHTAEGPFLQTYALPLHTPVAPLLALTASTSTDQDHPAETADQPYVMCPSGPRPYFMTELEAGSGIYFMAYVVDQREIDITLRFPGDAQASFCVVHWHIENRVNCDLSCLYGHLLDTLLK